MHGLPLSSMDTPSVKRSGVIYTVAIGSKVISTAKDAIQRPGRNMADFLKTTLSMALVKKSLLMAPITRGIGTKVSRMAWASDST